MFKHPLGHMATDKITGFTGVITSRVEFLTGCNRYHVQPREIRDAKVVEGMYFDEDQIRVSDEPVILRVEVCGDDPGACSPDPSK